MSARPRSPWLTPGVFGAAVLTLVLTGIAAGLGFWQLGAWQAEREHSAADRTSMTPVPLTEVMGPDDPFPGNAVGRPVTLDGTWQPDSTVLVPNRTRGEQEGWWVATAVTQKTSTEAGTSPGSSLYVVREFVTDPAGAGAEPVGPMQGTVWLEAAEGTSPERDTDPDDNRISAMRTAELLQHVQGDLYSGFGVVDERDLTVEAESTVWTGLRNFFYAFEWWVFGGFVVFMFIRFLAELRAQRWAEVAADFGIEDQPVAGEPVPAAADPSDSVEQAAGPAQEASAAATPASAGALTTAATVATPREDSVAAGATASADDNRWRDRLSGVSAVLTRYRVMAWIVGILLIVILLIGVPLKYFTGGPMWGLLDSTPALFTEGGTANQFGDWITQYLGIAHGWLYMIFLFAAFQLAMRSKWSFGFSAVTLICGTIPIVSFWAEHRAVKVARAQFPEELGKRASVEV